MAIKRLGPVSAYAIAVEHGYRGTEEEWLATLKGERGERGEPGAKGDSYVITEADKTEIAAEVEEKYTADLGELKQDILPLKTLVAHEEIGMLTPAYQLGFIDALGNETVSYTRIRTVEYLDIKKIHSIAVDDGYVYVLKLFNASGSCVYSSPAWLSTETLVSDLITAHTDAVSVRWCARFAAETTINDVDAVASHVNVNGYVTVEGQFYQLERQVNGVELKVDKKLDSVYTAKMEMETGSINNSNGNESTESNRVRTKEFIPVSASKKLVVLNGVRYTLRGYNSAKEYAQYSTGWIPNDGGVVSELVTDANIKYIRVVLSYADGHVDDALYQSLCVEDHVDIQAMLKLDEEQNERLDRIEAKIVDPDEEMPFDNIIHDGGFTAVFKTMGCIGDSLASGETYYNNSGDGKYHPLSSNFPISWGQCIARMCGTTAYNFSRGGQSAKSWLEEWGSRDQFINNPCEAYIIALGVNDSNTSSTAYTPVGTAEDVNSLTADSFYGYYAKIIRRIKEIQPKAKIFVLTVPTGASAENGYNDAVRFMPTIFNNVYLLDFRAYGAEIYAKLWEEGSAYCVNGHGTALMYQISAWHISSYIDYIIRHKPDDFADVQFIGTSHAVVG